MREMIGSASRPPEAGARFRHGRRPAGAGGKKRDRALSDTTMERAFQRSFDSLEGIFAFTGDFFAREKIRPDERHAVDLAVEELFTNMVKYNGDSSTEILLRMELREGELRIVLTDPDADPFDPTAVRAPRVDRPLEEREPGRLGLFLVRKLMDRIRYDYDGRRSRITMTKTLG
jgi:serine/threonine-protein kinase RsbW